MKTRINKGISDSSLQDNFACFLRAAASWRARITLTTLLWLGTCALALAQGTADNAYVTIVHPEGTKTYYSLPASPTSCDRGSALQQAKAAALFGDTIVVGPGDAQTLNLLKNGVNWYFVAGAKVIGACCSGQTGCSTGGIFKDALNTPVNCTIGGAGKFEIQTGTSAVVNLVDAGSNVSITADSMVAILSTLWTRRATLHAKANTITSNSISYPTVLWYSGSEHIEAHEIANLSGPVIHASQPLGESVGGYLWVQANLIKSTSADTMTPAIRFVDAEPSAREWIQALQIQGNVAIQKQANKTGLSYVRAEKVFGQINAEAGNTGILYVDAMKISPPFGFHLNDNLIKLNGGNSWINILQIDDSDLEDSTNSVPVVAASAGTHYLRGSSLARVSAGEGINVSGGILTVNGLAISTLNGSNDLVQTGGILKALSCGYSLLKTSGEITEGNPKVGILGTAAFEARKGQPIDQNGVFNGIIGLVTEIGQGQYQVSFGRSEPDTNYMVTAMAESENGTGTVCFWSRKSTNGFVLNLVDFKSGVFADQDGVRVTVSRIP